MLPLLYHKKGTQRFNVTKRLGTFLVVSNVVSIVLLAASISALSFLWFGGDTNVSWRRVMIHGWVNQVITLCTLAIRLAMSTQASTAIMMLAAISLESMAQGGVSLDQTPALSLARAVNTGPITSLLPFWRNLQRKRNMMVLIAVNFLACTSLLSQFTSTLLLWDVRPGPVLGFPTKTKAMIGYRMEDYTRGLFKSILSKTPYYWKASSPNYPTFAEWNSKPKDLPESVVDTGPTVRALLPLSSGEDRSKLSQYTGPASLFDARVVCARPPIVVNETWTFNETWTNILYWGSFSPAYLEDDLKDTFPFPAADTEVARYKPDLILKDKKSFLTDQTTSSFRIFSIPDTGLISSIDPIQDGTLQNFSSYKSPVNKLYQNFTEHESYFDGWKAMDNKNVEWNVETGWAYFLVKSSPPNLTHWDREEHPNRTVGNKGPWAEYLIPTSNGTLPVSVTMCYDALLHGLQNTTIFSKTVSSLDNAIYVNVAKVSTDQNIQTRWPLNMSFNPPQSQSYNNSETQEQFWTNYSTNETADFLSSTLNPVLNSLFLDIMEETENPALALQALLTSVIRTAYYDLLPTFNAEEIIETTSFEPCQVPQHTKGFTIVAVNIVLHLALFITTAIWFASTTRYSLLNNVWQAVAQLKAPETEELLKESSMVDDKTVRAHVNQLELRRRFFVQKRDDEERVCLS
ncbi:uncharacterized protein K452DRAFT_272481 [Aplosporella prunicola CBS 121167]|uniref:Uncharacterized protein n=1 Tax=Aplosporella prunicola CBS 121167 TaxID=1176127 RepID=A0A6A6BC52_9PEZI|nr:uncharacterized protein K452DRAFT_272481 [Aplosporella prunicola CBS 121167]KAF2140825.1 hypothetical protein K452DRAFT_272481 [Aplosporella prunicola CBS 121167]